MAGCLFKNKVMAKSTKEKIELSGVTDTTGTDTNTVSVTEIKEAKVIEKPDTEEVAFLKLLHRLQNDGGFGTHLNSTILDRIKELQSKK